MRPRAIHQFHAGSAPGDGITNAMFFIQAILRGAGLASDIHCIHVHPALAGRIRSHHEYGGHPDEVLLVHYSLGSDQDDWVAAQAARRILVYHNITPDHFFAAGSELARLAKAGRLQLERWAKEGTFAGAIADSDFNAGELTRLGFPLVESIGLLVDLDRIRAHAWTAAPPADAPIADAQAAGAPAPGAPGTRTLLFVGRLCPHKNQAGLVHMMAHLAASPDLPVRLLLPGAEASGDYGRHVLDTAGQLGLGARVRLLGPVSDTEVYGLYRSADLYVSMSQHEGFGMPLVEAMAFDLPVLAHAAGSVGATLGQGGLVLAQATPAQMAAAAAVMLREPPLRRRVLQGQRASLERFERPALVDAFRRFLRRAGIEAALGPARAAALPPPRWVVEGPYDSSYSLAVVNRELARALPGILAGSGAEAALASRDGPGPFAPDAAFLDANPDLAVMAERASAAGLPPAACLRNQYPPHVSDMRGAMRVLANFAWEESGLPASHAAEFNANLDLITVTSAWVAKVLRDNGVRVPVAVVGNGVDQALQDRLPPGPPPGPPGVFRFLHVSSGFPRKGVDVLLAAWGAAFTRDDPVELVLKTFPNIHNRVEEELAAHRAGHPDGAPVTLVNHDIPHGALMDLYAAASAIVNPSRGEGFGLPLAEAMALGIPVVTTGHGGQTDFCTADTAWLCGYSFAAARTHLGVPGSVWAEPDPASLAQAMRAVREAPPEERARRVELARARILASFTWERVAQRTKSAVDAVWASASPEEWRQPVIGMVSSWNVRCGIAGYAQSMAAALAAAGGPGRVLVFANRVGEQLQPDQDFVRRCWVQDWRDPLDELFEAICAAGVDAVVVQFNFGFFDRRALASLLNRLHGRGILAFIVLHSTQDVVKPDITFRLADMQPSLAAACRLLVHSVHDLNRLKGIGLVDNVALLPMGLPGAGPQNRDGLRRALGWGGRTVIASFGYLLPHKGLRELIAAFKLILAQRPDAHLAMLNAAYPAPESDEEQEACRAEIARLGIADRVSLVTAYMDEAEVIGQLGASDLVVYPYQHSGESASAAVKMGLASRTPVAVTPLPIFADVASVCHVLPGLSANEIARGVLELLETPAGAAFCERQATWAAAHAWPVVSARLDGLVTGEAAARRLNLTPDPDG